MIRGIEGRSETIVGEKKQEHSSLMEAFEKYTVMCGVKTFSPPPPQYPQWSCRCAETHFKVRNVQNRRPHIRTLEGWVILMKQCIWKTLLPILNVFILVSYLSLFVGSLVSSIRRDHVSLYKHSLGNLVHFPGSIITNMLNPKFIGLHLSCLHTVWPLTCWIFPLGGN